MAGTPLPARDLEVYYLMRSFPLVSLPILYPGRRQQASTFFTLSSGVTSGYEGLYFPAVPHGSEFDTGKDEFISLVVIQKQILCTLSQILWLPPIA